MIDYFINLKGAGGGKVDKISYISVCCFDLRIYSKLLKRNNGGKVWPRQIPSDERLPATLLIFPWGFA